MAKFTPSEAARILGRVTSPAKAAAARKNGKLGGRPKLPIEEHKKSVEREVVERVKTMKRQIERFCIYGDYPRKATRHD